MTHVKLTTGSPGWPLLRQTPSSRGVWRDCVFHVDDDTSDCDWWVVYEALPAKMTVRCKPGNTLFITAEPPEIRKYHPQFCRQFSHLITCQDIPHPHVLLRQQALPWHAGVSRTCTDGASARMGYDEFSQPQALQKRKMLSVITSNKTMIDGHRQRIAFVQELKQHFGDQLDVFGRGFNFIADKWDAIYPYRYHVTIENSTCRNFFTEKIADTFLAGAYPLYHGCQNLADYFPSGAFTSINIRTPAEAIAVIEDVMRQNLFETRQAELTCARNLVLQHYNLFAELANYCAPKHLSNSSPVPITLYPESHYGLRNMVKNTLRHIKRHYWQNNSTPA